MPLHVTQLRLLRHATLWLQHSRCSLTYWSRGGGEGETARYFVNQLVVLGTVSRTGNPYLTSAGLLFLTQRRGPSIAKVRAARVGAWGCWVVCQGRRPSRLAAGCFPGATSYPVSISFPPRLALRSQDRTNASADAGDAVESLVNVQHNTWVPSTRHEETGRPYLGRPPRKPGVGFADVRSSARQVAALGAGRRDRAPETQ